MKKTLLASGIITALALTGMALAALPAAAQETTPILDQKISPEPLTETTPILDSKTPMPSTKQETTPILD